MNEYDKYDYFRFLENVLKMTTSTIFYFLSCSQIKNIRRNGKVVIIKTFISIKVGA